MIISAFKIASSASGLIVGSGSRNTRLIAVATAPLPSSPLGWGMLDSPTRVWPSAISAIRVTSRNVDGTICPRTARTRPDSRIACSKSPVISAMAMMKRFPNECPFRLPSLKRCWKRVVMSGSTSASAVMHCRKSPGGKIRYSARSRPERPQHRLGEFVEREQDDAETEGGEEASPDVPAHELEGQVVKDGGQPDPGPVDVGQRVADPQADEDHPDHEEDEPTFDMKAG